MKNLLEHTRSKINNFNRWFIILLVVMATIAPVLSMSRVDSAQLTSRKVTVSSSKADLAGVTYSFSFSNATASAIQSMSFQFCNTPLGTCVLPGTDGTPTAAEKIDVSHVTAAAGSFTGTNATAFAEYTGADAGGCTESDGGSGVATQYCITRTEAASESVGTKTFEITGISNPIITNTTYETVYVRITTYSDTAFATAVDSGTVAAGITQQLTVNGRVQERLEFCVAAIDDGGATDTSLPSACSAAPTTTTIDIGVIDNTQIVKAPVTATTTNGANDDYGIAMVNTNASNGLVLAYFVQPDGSAQGAPDNDQQYSFKVDNANCDPTSSTTTDQCFYSAASGGTTFSAGSERFGLNIPCIMTTQGTTSNMGSVPAAYSNTDNTTTNDPDCENDDAGVKFAWNETSSAVTLASSSSVVDDEIVKLSFGATASATTPTGSYTVVTTYIATPTF